MIFHLLDTLPSRVRAKVGRLDWDVFGFFVLGHMGITWAGFVLAGEDHLTGFANFVYYYATTASTIGYGDLSPQGPAGRLFAAAWLFPGSLIIFTLFLSKVMATLGASWRKRMEGYGEYSRDHGSIVLVGWDPHRTPAMIAEIHAGKDADRKLVLVADSPHGVDPTKVAFVLAPDLSRRDDLLRAGVAHAHSVAVYTGDDDTTLAAALAVASLAPSAHLVAYFERQDRADLLKAHTHAVCVVDQSAEVVVREMQDPGVASLFTDLSSARSHASVFSLPKEATDDATVGEAFQALRRLQATLLGVKQDGGEAPAFTLPDGTPLAGRRVYYIADARVGTAAFRAALAQHRSAT